MNLERAERRLFHKERDYELSQRIKDKVSEEYEVLELSEHLSQILRGKFRLKRDVYEKGG